MTRPLKLVETSPGHGALAEFDADELISADLLPPIAQVMPVHTRAYPIAASAEEAGYEAATLNNQTGLNVLSSVVSGGGWVAALGTTPPYIDVAMPFGVFIGDSLAAGRPAEYGRLQPGGVATFDPAYPSIAGQPSYEFSRLTRSHWYNHGIGGQTTDQILARFDRDAIGLVSDVGDGRGTQTLPGAPYAAFVFAGTNDVMKGNPIESSKAALMAMLHKLQSAQIIPIFATVGACSAYTAPQRAFAQELNDWMLTELRARGAHIFDLYSWGSDGADGVRPDRYVDNIHPSRAGYAQLAMDALESLRLPLVCTGIRLEFKVDPAGSPAGWVAPVKISVTREGATVPAHIVSDWVEVSGAALPALQSPIARVAIERPISGKAGLSKVECALAVYNTEHRSYGRLAVNAVIHKTAGGSWQFSTGHASQGVLAISASATEVSIDTVPVLSYQANFVGAAGATNQLRLSPVWTTVPAVRCRLRFGDGVNALDPTGSGVPSNTYYSLWGD